VIYNRQNQDRGKAMTRSRHKRSRQSSTPLPTTTTPRTRSRTVVPPQGSNYRMTVIGQWSQNQENQTLANVTSPSLPNLARCPPMSPQPLAAYPKYMSVPINSKITIMQAQVMGGLYRGGPNKPLLILSPNPAPSDSPAEPVPDSPCPVSCEWLWDEAS
jgi:hypothetical protein